MSTFSKTAREVEMPNGDIVVLHNAVTENTTSNIKKFKYDDNGHVTESTAANATDLNLNSYSTPTTGTTAIGTSDAVQTAIGKLDHQSQIDQTNISYTLNRTGKNLLNTPSVTVSGKSWNTDSDGYITAVDTTGDSRALNYDNCQYYCHLRSGTYKLVVDIKTASSNSSAIASIYSKTGTISTNNLQNKTGVQVYEFTISTEDDYGVLTKLYAGSWRIMICEADMYAKDTSYVPYALPNYDLTRLEAEDRASLAEVVDSGAKNQLDFANLPYQTNTGVTFNKTNTEITVTSSNTSWGYVCYKCSLPAGSYVFSCKISNLVVASGTRAAILLDTNTTAQGTRIATQDVSAGTVSFPFTWTGGTFYIFYYPGYTNVTNSNSFTASENMICTKAAFGVSQKFVPFGNDPFYQVPINHNMIYRGQNLGATLTDAQHTALSSGNFTDLYLGDYWTKTVTVPAGTYTGGDGEEVTVPAQTNITLKAVIADFDTFYAGYASSFAGINTHHAAVIVTGFSNVVWNKTNSTAGGYVASLIHKWLVGSALPQIETWFGSAKVLSHQKLLTNAITGDAASGGAWSSQKISLLSENQMYGSKVWGNSKAANGGYEPGEAFKNLNVFNHIDANLLFGNKNIWLRDIASAVWAALLNGNGTARYTDASYAWVAPAALILLS